MKEKIKVEIDKGIVSHFIKIRDPRVKNRCEHLLIDIVVISVCAILCGANSWVDIEEYGHQREEWFKELLELPGGIPSHDTIARVFAILKAEEFEKAFHGWMESVLGKVKYKRLSIDGKSVAGTERSMGKRPLHLVSVYSNEYGVVLGQSRAATSGSTEVFSALECLELIDIEETVISMDAGLSTHRMAEGIVSKKGHYLCPIKKNQRHSLEEIETIYRKKKITDTASTKEKNRGRIEKRSCEIMSSSKFSEEFLKQWPSVKTVARIERVRNTKDVRFVVLSKEAGKRFKKNKKDRKETREVIYYISSKKLSAMRFLEEVREHWAIENKLHWQLDVTFHEDSWRTRRKVAAQNLSVVRKMAFNIISRCKQKGSKRLKMKRAAWNDAYMETLLFG